MTDKMIAGYANPSIAGLDVGHVGASRGPLGIAAGGWLDLEDGRTILI